MIDLTDDELAALIALVRKAIVDDLIHSHLASKRPSRRWRSSIRLPYRNPCPNACRYQKRLCVTVAAGERAARDAHPMDWYGERLPDGRIARYALFRRVSSGASRSSYAAGLRANWHPSPDASGVETTFCPTRNQRRGRRKLRRVGRGHTTGRGRTNTRKHWSLAEQIRCRAPRRERREAFSCGRMYAQPRRGIPSEQKKWPRKDQPRGQVIGGWGGRCSQGDRNAPPIIGLTKRALRDFTASVFVP
jgi:hypothetical protein